MFSTQKQTFGNKIGSLEEVKGNVDFSIPFL